MRYVLFSAVISEPLETPKGFMIPNGRSLDTLVQSLIAVAVNAKTHGYALIVIPSESSPWTDRPMLDLALHKTFERMGVPFSFGDPLVSFDTPPETWT